MVAFMQALLDAGAVVKFWPDSLWRDPVYAAAAGDGRGSLPRRALARGHRRDAARMGLARRGAAVAADVWPGAPRRRACAFAGCAVAHYGHDLHFRRMREQDAQAGGDDARACSGRRMRCQARERACGGANDVVLYPSDGRGGAGTRAGTAVDARAVLPYATTDSSMMPDAGGSRRRAVRRRFRASAERGCRTLAGGRIMPAVGAASWRAPVAGRLEPTARGEGARRRAGRGDRVRQRRRLAAPPWRGAGGGGAAALRRRRQEQGRGSAAAGLPLVTTSVGAQGCRAWKPHAPWPTTRRRWPTRSSRGWMTTRPVVGIARGAAYAGRGSRARRCRLPCSGRWGSQRGRNGHDRAGTRAVHGWDWPAAGPMSRRIATLHGGYVMNAPSTSTRMRRSKLATRWSSCMRSMAGAGQLRAAALDAIARGRCSCWRACTCASAATSSVANARHCASALVGCAAGFGLGLVLDLVVALVAASAEYFALGLGEYEVAHLAYEVERQDLAGRRQAGPVRGGVRRLQLHGVPCRRPRHRQSLRIKDWVLAELEASLLLYFTGVSRESARIIDEQSRNAERGPPRRWTPCTRSSARRCR